MRADWPRAGIEELEAKRKAIVAEIDSEEEKKTDVQTQLREQTEKLSRINDSLGRKVSARNEYDTTIQETEAAYLKVHHAPSMMTLRCTRCTVYWCVAAHRLARDCVVSCHLGLKKAMLRAQQQDGESLHGVSRQWDRDGYDDRESELWTASSVSCCTEGCQDRVGDPQHCPHLLCLTSRLSQILESSQTLDHVMKRQGK